MNLLRELCEAAGIPGREERVRAIVRRELEGLTDEIRVDALGNLIAHRRGTVGRSLAIQAHMDEIGFMVTHVDDKGFLRLTPLGGHDPRNMVAQRVRVAGKRDLDGVLYPEQKPPHLQAPNEKEKSPQLGAFFVDVGLPVTEVKELVPIGSMAVIHREMVEVGNTVSCKAMDDRVSVYIMIEAMRRAARSGFDVFAVATVQEEVGLRGAYTSAYDLHPDVGLALDVTLAMDIPGQQDHEHITRLGQGTAIKLMDSASISNLRLVEVLRDLAEKRGIRYQHEILPRGGTDAGAMQRARGGVPVCTISTPTRYIHASVEMCHKEDIEASIALTVAFIEEGAEHEYLPR